MKKLFLLRHAKSFWDFYDGNDLNRDISEVGVEKTNKIGRFLKQEKICIDRVLCSHSLRTKKTNKIILNYLNPKPKVLIKEELYHDTKTKIFDVVSSQNSGDSLLIVSHEPLLSNSINDFSNDNRNKNFQNARIKFPTSGLFNLIFYVKSWKDISPDNSEIVFFKRPKDLF